MTKKQVLFFTGSQSVGLFSPKAIGIEMSVQWKYREIPLYSLDTLFSIPVHREVKMTSHQKPHKRKLPKTKVDFHVNCLRPENKHITGTYCTCASKQLSIMVTLDNFGRIHDDLMVI